MELVLTKRLRERRNAIGATQADVAEALGVSPKTVSHWENGAREPDLATLTGLAQLYGTSVAYFVGETDDPTPLPVSDSDIIRADMPLPPIGWDKLSDEEKEEVRQITRRFEETIIADIVRKNKGRE